ncbi:MAG: alpha/beta hydrolase, partial [Paracoccus sp. (in: a-proteobacteria)]|nr:alpha/beta hydrolase [Paracoccus sp. (in: a-proteobacteria)]
MLYRVDDWDEAYANAAHIAQGDSYPDRWRKAAAAFRASHAPVALQGGDLFRPKARACGLMVFIHGGYWMDFAPSDWSHLAAGALERGWACLIPAYPLAPKARIAEMTRTVAAGITEAAALIAGPVAITGHSAGGHLAARMICTNVLPDAVANRIRTCRPISPLSDLRPLMRT